MALGTMYILVTCSTLGADAGPFNLYSNVTGYLSAFATNVSAAELAAGYFTEAAPVGTTDIMIQSVGGCTNHIIIPVSTPTTTTSSSTLPMMWPVVGTCCGLVGTEYFPSDGVTVFQVGDIIAATMIPSGFFGGWEIQGPPVPAVQTLILYDNTNYFSCANYDAVFAGVACL